MSNKISHSYAASPADYSLRNCLSTVTFDPPFSSLRQEAIEQGHVNLGSKIHFEQAKTTAPWVAFCSPRSTATLSSALSDHSSGESSYAVAFGYAEAQLDLAQPDTVRKEINALFPPDEQPDITAYLTHDWANDPFAKGAWVAFPPDFMRKYQQELQKDHGKVMFASGDWADGWRGFVDGAIASGSMSARRIIQASKLRRTTPSSKE